MITTSQLLVRGLGIDYAGQEPVDIPAGTFCIVCGGPVGERGYEANQIISDATTEYLDQFRGNPSGHICVWCATCYKNSAPRAGMPTNRACMAFEDAYCWPLIGRATASGNDDRPCWSDLVRDVWPGRVGQPVLVVLTTDQRRRLWPRARVGPLGITTPVYLFDADTHLDGVHIIDWPAMIECLTLIEDVYNAGFSKISIRESLFTIHKHVQEVGFVKTAEWERALSAWRGRSEFHMATLVAQKGEES